MPTMFADRSALVPTGPRIAFDCMLPWEFFELPGNRTILRALALEAPPLVDDVVVITSAWRPPSGAFSWHWKAHAIDSRTGVDGETRRGAIIAPTREDRIRLAGLWAARLRLRLGSEFDVVFGDAAHIDHIHTEHDGVKAVRRYHPAVSQ